MLYQGSEIFTLTGHSEHWWMSHIQSLIAKHTVPTGDTNHGYTPVKEWIQELANDIQKTVDAYTITHKADENIVASSVLSLIMTLWSVRVRRAKCYDPNRPIALRQEAMRRLFHYLISLQSIIIDESQDHLFFPHQQWDPPFAPDARDGSFI